MLKVIIAGRLGRDAQHKTTQSGTDLCSFAVAADVGYGDAKQTYWVDVTKWGKGAEGLSRILRKGSAVTVVGELSTREHDGKTYLQCRADDVTIQGGTQRQEQSGQSQNPPPLDDLDDDVPFD
jgi:single-strand DNA-binding protein